MIFFLIWPLTIYFIVERLIVNWGNEFITHDLTLRYAKSGTTLTNMGEFSIFYKCKRNYDGAINSFKRKQFYRECEIKGNNSYLI